MALTDRLAPRLLDGRLAFMAGAGQGNGCLGYTEDLVGPVIFLASNMSRYATGITMAVDGGFLAV